MEPHRLAALLLASAVNAVIPGPGMVLAIARAASDGLGPGIKVSLGMILATLLVMCTVWAVLPGLFHLSELCGPAASRSGAGPGVHRDRAPRPDAARRRQARPVPDP